MHGRRLATTEKLIAVASPDSDEPLSRLRAWADDAGVALSVVALDDDVGDAYEPGAPTLGVTLGGDGTFLEGVKRFAPLGIPQLGINAGSVSFLARVEVDDLEAAMDEVLCGRATVDRRQQVRVEASGVDATGINDVMLQRVPPENPFDRKVTQLEVFADGEYVGQYEGTGIAVATPTGSTGIALSAGGPVHLPADNHTLQIVPLHTHSMGVRPLVVAAETELEVVTRGRASLLVDGGRAYKVLGDESVVRITGAEQCAHVVRTSYDDQFMTALTGKLNWGLRDEADGPRDLLDSRTAGAHEPSIRERARDVAIEAARSVGDPLRELHGRVEDVTYKTDKADIVTEGSAPYTWVIDPIDGTGNFTHGNPNYAVSIALLDEDTPVMGVVSVPETDEIFHAIEGGDAYADGVRITTTDRDELAESMLLTGYDPDGEFLAHYYHETRGVRSLGETRGVRSLGSAALNLCYLASGSADALWEYDTHPWDVAAGLVIARAAGARITDDDEPYVVEFDADERKPLLGSNGPLHPALYAHLERSGLT
ncbi:inositol monophosphatase [Halobacteriales archaeon SW_10_66_29]|nr:MAG: inositol monophosphatase [Halobacteriales archaeon SW_10_66_29]